MAEIEWEDPPMKAKSPGQHDAFAAALRERPGQWAVFKRNTWSNVAVQVRNGSLRAFQPVGEWEARSSSVSSVDGTPRVDVYVRYVGPTLPSSKPEDD